MEGVTLKQRKIQQVNIPPNIYFASEAEGRLFVRLLILFDLKLATFLPFCSMTTTLTFYHTRLASHCSDVILLGYIAHKTDLQNSFTVRFLMKLCT